MRSTTSRIARRPGPPGTAGSGRTIADVFQAAKKPGGGVDTPPHLHFRRHPRRKIMAAVDLSIYRADGTVHDRGSAVVKDLSLSGALLIAVAIPRRSIPVGPVTVGLRLLAERGESPELRGLLVRFRRSKDSLGFAVRFLESHAKQAGWFCGRLRRAPAR